MIGEWYKNPFFRFKTYKEYMDLTFDQILDYYNFWHECLDFNKSEVYQDFVRKHILSAWAAFWDLTEKKDNKK